LIGNINETPLTFDMPNNMTVEKTGSRTVSICTTGHKKSNFTVVLSCIADGIMIHTNWKEYMNLDEMICYLTDSVKNRFDEKNTNLAVIPGCLTSKLQPLDVNINKLFKNKYCQCYNDWMAEEIKKSTPTGYIQCPAYNLVAQWVKISWDKIDPMLIQHRTSGDYNL
ncbi:4467_t:CDS:2, partial [Diversispora eburnea]